MKWYALIAVASYLDSIIYCSKNKKYTYYFFLFRIVPIQEFKNLQIFGIKRYFQDRIINLS